MSNRDWCEEHGEDYNKLNQEHEESLREEYKEENRALSTRHKDVPPTVKKATRKVMSEIDKWAAERCGVELAEITNDDRRWYRRKGKYFEWTIEDPRCREIVREHFRIETRDRVDSWLAVQLKWSKHPDYPETVVCPSGQGKTIAEAEIACITAIWEAQK